MLFQGSANVGTNDHFRYLQEVGGVANGSTWYDRTNYYETLPSRHLDLALWLESDRMGFLLPGLTAEKLENQRQVVMNERRQRVDNQPYGRAMERLFELLFPEDHPYRWPVIGWMEDIEAATLDDVRAFFSTYYGAVERRPHPGRRFRARRSPGVDRALVRRPARGRAGAACPRAAAAARPCRARFDDRPRTTAAGSISPSAPSRSAALAGGPQRSPRIS